MKKTILRNYARLIARMGGSVKKGDEVRIDCGIDQPEFVAMLTEECYRAGAANVVVEFSYQPLAKLGVQYRSLENLSKIADYAEARWKHDSEVLPVKIYLLSEDPDGMKGADVEKMSRARQSQLSIIKPYRDKMENKYKWCIAAVPGTAWAKKMFPDERASIAVEKLWNAILFTSRVVDENGSALDPLAEWKAHNDDLRARFTYLNSLGISSLHYTAENGTDFTVGMMDEGIFAGGGEELINGEFFNPNIPSEEVFTSPKRGVADGIVYASKPLSYQGQLIENFSIRFENGKAVEVRAERGQALLEKMISMDEGAAYLGECALVPYHSPIRESGYLFYETLFDENAACHLALGHGFADCVRDYQHKTLEECRALGVNESMIHVDFMIGTSDLSITANTKDDREVPVFRNGDWAF